MSTHTQNVQCFTTVGGENSHKSPPFKHRTSWLPRIPHHGMVSQYKPLEECYLCSGCRHVHALETLAKPPCLYHTQYHSYDPQQCGLKRPTRPKADPPGRSIYHHRYNKRVVLLKNSDPSFRKTIVLHHRSLGSFGLFLEEVSELMDYHTRKLYTLEGHRIDSVQSLIQCPSVLVCVGREPTHPSIVETFQKMSDDNFPRLSMMSQSDGCSDGHEGQPLMSNGTTSKLESESRPTRPFVSPDKSLPDGSESPDNVDSCPHTDDGMRDDDIEKRVRVNKDGSLSMEMKVRFRLQNNETLHWSTEVLRRRNRECLSRQNKPNLAHCNDVSCSEFENISAGEFHQANIKRCYQRHPEEPYHPHCSPCKDHDIWKNAPPTQEASRCIQSSSSTASSHTMVSRKTVIKRQTASRSSEEHTEEMVERQTCVKAAESVEYSVLKCETCSPKCKVKGKEEGVSFPSGSSEVLAGHVEEKDVPLSATSGVLETESSTQQLPQSSTARVPNASEMSSKSSKSRKSLTCKHRASNQPEDNSKGQIQSQDEDGDVQRDQSGATFVKSNASESSAQKQNTESKGREEKRSQSAKSTRSNASTSKCNTSDAPKHEDLEPGERPLSSRSVKSTNCKASMTETAAEKQKSEEHVDKGQAISNLPSKSEASIKSKGSIFARPEQAEEETEQITDAATSNESCKLGTCEAFAEEDIQSLHETSQDVIAQSAQSAAKSNDSAKSKHSRPSEAQPSVNSVDKSNNSVHSPVTLNLQNTEIFTEENETKEDREDQGRVSSNADIAEAFTHSKASKHRDEERNVEETHERASSATSTEPEASEIEVKQNVEARQDNGARSRSASSGVSSNDTEAQMVETLERALSAKSTESNGSARSKKSEKPNAAEQSVASDVIMRLAKSDVCTSPTNSLRNLSAGSGKSAKSRRTSGKSRVSEVQLDNRVEVAAEVVSEAQIAANRRSDSSDGKHVVQNGERAASGVSAESVQSHGSEMPTKTAEPSAQSAKSNISRSSNKSNCSTGVSADGSFDNPEEENDKKESEDGAPSCLSLKSTQSRVSDKPTDSGERASSSLSTQSVKSCRSTKSIKSNSSKVISDKMSSTPDIGDGEKRACDATSAISAISASSKGTTEDRSPSNTSTRMADSAGSVLSAEWRKSNISAKSGISNAGNDPREESTEDTTAQDPPSRSKQPKASVPASESPVEEDTDCPEPKERPSSTTLIKSSKSDSSLRSIQSNLTEHTTEPHTDTLDPTERATSVLSAKTKVSARSMKSSLSGIIPSKRNGERASNPHIPDDGNPKEESEKSNISVSSDKSNSSDIYVEQCPHESDPNSNHSEILNSSVLAMSFKDRATAAMSSKSQVSTHSKRSTRSEGKEQLSEKRHKSCLSANSDPSLESRNSKVPGILTDEYAGKEVEYNMSTINGITSGTTSESSINGGEVGNSKTEIAKPKLFSSGPENCQDERESELNNQHVCHTESNESEVSQALSSSDHIKVVGGIPLIRHSKLLASERTVNGHLPAADIEGSVTEAKSAKSGKQRWTNTNVDGFKMVPSNLPTASPTEVVNDWLKTIPADSHMCVIGELNGSCDGQIADQHTIEEINGREESAAEEQRDEGVKNSASGNECQRNAKAPNLDHIHAEKEAPTKTFNSATQVMKVLLNPKHDRCNSVPEISPVYGRKLSTSAQGLLDCLVKLKLIDSNPENANERDARYQELMNILQSLWICAPQENEIRLQKCNCHFVEDEFNHTSTSGVDVNSGSTGSGKSSVGVNADLSQPHAGADTIMKAQEVCEGQADAESKQTCARTAEAMCEKNHKDADPGRKEAIRSKSSPKELPETPQSPQKSSGNDSSGEKLEEELTAECEGDSNSGNPLHQREQYTKAISLGPDLVWVLSLLTKIEKQFMTHHANAMREFKVRWNFDDNELLDTMINELRAEVHKKIQTTIDREWKKIQSQAGPPRPTKDAMTHSSSAQTNERRWRLKTILKQSDDLHANQSNGSATGTPYSDQRSEDDDEYCPCETCVRKKIASRTPIPAEVYNTAPVAMDFDLKRILLMKNLDSTKALETKTTVETLGAVRDVKGNEEQYSREEGVCHDEGQEECSENSNVKKLTGQTAAEDVEDVGSVYDTKETRSKTEDESKIDAEKADTAGETLEMKDENKIEEATAEPTSKKESGNEETVEEEKGFDDEEDNTATRSDVSADENDENVKDDGASREPAEDEQSAENEMKEAAPENETRATETGVASLIDQLDEEDFMEAMTSDEEDETVATREGERQEQTPEAATVEDGNVMVETTMRATSEPESDVERAVKEENIDDDDEDNAATSSDESTDENDDEAKADESSEEQTGEETTEDVASVENWQKDDTPENEPAPREDDIMDAVTPDDEGEIVSTSEDQLQEEAPEGTAAAEESDGASLSINESDKDNAEEEEMAEDEKVVEKGITFTSEDVGAGETTAEGECGEEITAEAVESRKEEFVNEETSSDEASVAHVSAGESEHDNTQEDTADERTEEAETDGEMAAEKEFSHQDGSETESGVAATTQKESDPEEALEAGIVDDVISEDESEEEGSRAEDNEETSEPAGETTTEDETADEKDKGVVGEDESALESADITKAKEENTAGEADVAATAEDESDMDETVEAGVDDDGGGCPVRSKGDETVESENESEADTDKDAVTDEAESEAEGSTAAAGDGWSAKGDGSKEEAVEANEVVQNHGTEEAAEAGTQEDMEETVAAAKDDKTSEAKDETAKKQSEEEVTADGDTTKEKDIVDEEETSDTDNGSNEETTDEEELVCEWTREESSKAETDNISVEDSKASTSGENESVNKATTRVNKSTSEEDCLESASDAEEEPSLTQEMESQKRWGMKILRGVNPLITPGMNLTKKND